MVFCKLVVACCWNLAAFPTEKDRRG